MRITHRMIADTANYNLQHSLRRLNHYSNQLSTGKLFSRPSENPVGVGRVMNYSGAIDRNEQFRLNMNQARGWLDNTESSLQNAIDVMQRIRELAIYGANESLTASDRRAIAPEVQEFIEHLVGIANTEVSGLYIFGGHQTLRQPYLTEELYRVAIGFQGGLSRDEARPVQAHNLQNGDYRLDQLRILADEERTLPASITMGQQVLAGSAYNIFGSAALSVSSLPGNMALPTLTDGSSLQVGEEFLAGDSDGDFVLYLDYEEDEAGGAGSWVYLDEDGQRQAQASGSFTYRGVSVDLDALAGQPAPGDRITVAAGINSEVLLEVDSVDRENGAVSYTYQAHNYALDGSYLATSGTFSLQWGGDDDQEVNLGASRLLVTGLGSEDPLSAISLQPGDVGLVQLSPARAAGERYDEITVSAQHRAGVDQKEGTGPVSGAFYRFHAGVLDESDARLRFFTLDDFSRSPEKGRVYDGSITVPYDIFSSSVSPALAFSYDRLGFPVYRGDDKERIQEISPFQELTMNLSGEKAFGAGGEIFDAIHAVYWALMDNDREVLGSTALEKMDRSVDHLLERLAQVGARSNRLEAMHSTLTGENLFLREMRSMIEDIDLADVITEFTMQENAYRAALSTASMMLQPTLVDYWR